MKAENLKRRVIFISLVFALVFSTISVAPLAHSGELFYDPSGTTTVVEQGGTFLIKHTLAWNEPENGAYVITIAWDCYNNEPSENFTFLSASAYFTTGPHVGQSILADVTMGSAPAGTNTRHALSVKCPSTNKDPRNGQFNVDIWMGAYGVGGVPHILGDHVIPFQFAGVVISEKYVQYENRDPITVRVLSRGVSVSISPSVKNSLPEQTLSYTVTVKNIGDLDDRYALTISDNIGWGPTLLEGLLVVPAGENRQTTLSVTVPANALGGTKDMVTVTAASQENTDVSDNASCIARSNLVAVEVSISPNSQSAQPGTITTYSVTVTNKGDFADNYNLIVGDDAGWGATLAQNLLIIPAGGVRTTTVIITVPSDAAGDELTGIAVTASSQADPNVSNYDTCTAIAERVPTSGPPIPISVIGGAAIGVGAVAVIVLLLWKRGVLHLSFLRPYSAFNNPITYIKSPSEIILGRGGQ